MPDIMLTRIDNRLVHGQVGVTWVNHLRANLIVVANDAAASDPVQQNLMEMVIPTTCGIRFFSIQKTIDIIDKASPKQHIFLVVRTPEDALRLVEGGVPIKKINIGNLHFSEGKTQISSTVFIGDSERDAFRKLLEKGVELEIRRVPTEGVEADIRKFL